MDCGCKWCVRVDCGCKGVLGWRTVDVHVSVFG